MSEFSDATIRRIIKSQTDKQVGQDAIETLRSELENKAREISDRAVEKMHESERITVRADEIEASIDEADF